MPATSPDPKQRSRSLPFYRRQTERRLVAGFFVLLLVVGGALIGGIYGWGGMIGGLLSIVACTLALAGVAGLLWLLLTAAGRWANGE